MSRGMAPAQERTREERSERERRDVPQVSQEQPASESERLQYALGNQGVMRAVGGGGEGIAGWRGGKGDAIAYLLDDAAAEVGPGQMRRGEFLRVLERAVYQTAEEGLAPAGRTAHDCPYLRAMFRFYGSQDAAAVGRAMRRYAPETAAAGSALESAWLISARVRDSVHVWASTGRIERAPEWEGDSGELVAAQLRSGPGQALPSSVRGPMESAFGESFGEVRAHVGGHAERLTRDLSARAVTIGSDIYFGRDEYKPGTLVGDAILAHELAHVMQQRGAAPVRGEIADHGTRNEFETDADRAAGAAVQSTWTKTLGAVTKTVQRARVTLRTGLSIQRCGGGGAGNQASGPISFASANFNPTLSGGLIIADEAGVPAPGSLNVSSQDYNASGDVTVSGGTDTDAADWQAGFMQTAVSSNKDLDYRDASNTHVAFLKIAMPGAHRDGVAGVEPWYGNETVQNISATNSTVSPSMYDAPGVQHIPWELSLGGSTGKLRSSTGKDEYCSWLMVRQRSTSNITYLNWDTWEVDWTAVYDPVAKTGSGTGSGCRVTGQGAGRGAVTPLTTDPVANGSDTVDVVP